MFTDYKIAIKIATTDSEVRHHISVAYMDHSDGLLTDKQIEVLADLAGAKRAMLKLAA